VFADVRVLDVDIAPALHPWPLDAVVVDLDVRSR
jgi:hypothetical protein